MFGKHAAAQCSVLTCAFTLCWGFLILPIESNGFDYSARNKEKLGTLSDGNETTFRRFRRHIDSECSNNYTVNVEGGRLTSPGYPEQYSTNLDCQWRLTSSTESNIVLKFSETNIEETENCEYDYVAIFDGNSALLHKLCGNYKDKTLIVNSTIATIHFHSDASYTKMGFALHYNLEKEPGCQAFLKESQGVLTSPQYPDNYSDNKDCYTQITVDSSASILLKFDVLNLEYEANCSFDYVAVYDGTTVEAPLLGNFCSNPENATVMSSNNSLLVHFHSDHLLNYNGFSASYSSIFFENRELGDCQWNKDKWNGTISSPNYPYRYGRNSNCIIQVQAPENFVISVFIDDISMETDDNCTYDSLEIRDGLTQGSPLVRNYCGKVNEETNITSTDNALRFTFRSDNFAEFTGFHLQYWIHKKEETQQENEGVENFLPARPAIKDVPASPHAFNEFPQNATAILGESHVMSCKPKVLTAKVRWLKDDQFLGGLEPLPGISLISNGTILWIHSMSANLKGVYTCAAVTPDGVSYSVQALVNIKEQSANCNINYRHRPTNTTILEDDSAFIQCSLSRSRAQISWMRNGFPLLPSGKHYRQILNGNLLIEKADPDMSGVYTCVAEDKASECVMHSSAYVSIPQRVNIKNVCGHPVTGNPNTKKPQIIHEKIIGGNKTEKGAYPWQVLLFDTPRGGFCGGSLLNERWVVTAAHCLFIRKRTQLIDKSRVVIKLGKHNQFTVEAEEVVTGIELFVIHPAYQKHIYDNDIALIKLHDTIHFTNYISPVCLGTQEFIRDMFFEKPLRMGTVTGWGQLTEKGPRPQYLQELRMPVVNWETCRQSTKYRVTKNMFCAGYAQEIIGDACKGDSGGPFVMEQDGTWYLVGIVSWGDGCGRTGQYGFYTKVDNYHTWIKGIID